MPNLRSNTESLPTHDEIAIRAYHLYLKSSEGFSATEHWIIAEEELKKELAGSDAKLPKGKTAAPVLPVVLCKSVTINSTN